MRRLLFEIARRIARTYHPRGINRVLEALSPPGDQGSAYASYVGRYDGDLLLQIDTRSYIEWCVHAHGGHEIGALAVLKSLTHAGAVVVDVGANVGTVTLPLARRVGPSGAVHAFEPHPTIRQRLTENVRLNNLQNVTICPLALSDTSGDVTLYASTTANQGLASLTVGPETGDALPCRQETLDRYVESVGLERVDVIKIDTEGAEMGVLRGAQTTVERFGPAIYVEVCAHNLARFGAAPCEILGFLHARGYRVFRHTRAGNFMFDPNPSLRRVGERESRFAPIENWLAVRLGPGEPDQAGSEVVGGRA